MMIMKNIKTTKVSCKMSNGVAQPKLKLFLEKKFHKDTD